MFTCTHTNAHVYYIICIFIKQYKARARGCWSTMRCVTRIVFSGRAREDQLILSEEKNFQYELLVFSVVIWLRRFGKREKTGPCACTVCRAKYGIIVRAARCINYNARQWRGEVILNEVDLKRPFFLNFFSKHYLSNNSYLISTKI